MAVLCGIIGDWGGGKTLFCVRKAWQTFLKNRHRKVKRKIYTNIELKPPLEYEPLDLQQMINQKVSDAEVFLDEGYLYMPSRRSQTDSNLDMVNSIQQIRKRRVNVYWTFQDRKDTERMIREKATHYVIAEQKSWGFNYTILRRRYTIGMGLLDETLVPFKTIQVPYSHAQLLYKLYDHEQIISTVKVKEERKQYDTKKRANKAIKEEAE